MRDSPHRARWRIIAAILLVIPLGLLTRSGLPMPGFVAAYGGDTLYATLVYLLVALIWLRAAIGRVGLAALGLCVAIELGQLYHAPWLDAIRATTPGRLVLGSGFLWSDLACYAVGVVLGVAVDLALRCRR
ncbi:DUF2809 domain-containing protein [Chloroflexales bacterium ZM16-3]|nr:DUF2809 domain-containing protein [Chloroflexales bacterium ZM16-3]